MKAIRWALPQLATMKYANPIHTDAFFSPVSVEEQCLILAQVNASPPRALYLTPPALSDTCPINGYTIFDFSLIIGCSSFPTYLNKQILSTLHFPPFSLTSPYTAKFLKNCLHASPISSLLICSNI